MKRHEISPRSNWQRKVEEVGLTYHTLDSGQPYWNEGAYYEFSSGEIDRIEAATNMLHEMCLQAAQRVIDTNRFHDFSIPDAAVPIIKRAWEDEPPAIYGRMDLAYTEDGEIKLLEYNADTPTALVEAAIAQWYWLQDKFPLRDQFNSLHERLIAKWKELLDYCRSPLFFAHVSTPEDLMTVSYLRDTASQAGHKTRCLLMEQVGWDQKARRFVGLEDEPILSLFKLYPWEMMAKEPFGQYALDSYPYPQWIEPVWKMLLSNKAILAVLWEMFPGHEHLLPAYLDGPRNLDRWVSKPLLGREGANIDVVQYGVSQEKTTGMYAGPRVCQQLTDIKTFSGFHPVIGSWMIDQEAGGMGIRESKSLITGNTSCFVPHLF